ncbi:MAG: YbaB/EbfC family nucleoid-associated protein [Phycisphaerae bacterium]|nr:YbaB/EbfC family nucleoid-associated protein [Phycisphaerae bacterium]
MFGDFGKMMKLAGELKTRLPEIQAKLAAAECTASAGGGVVSATVNGKMQLVDIKLDEKLLADGDAEILADLIKAAVSAAQQTAADAAAEAMKELTGGMELPGLGGLMT